MELAKKESYFLGIYWGPRKENIDICADKVKSTFDFLSTFHKSFQNWYRTQKPKKGQPLMPIDLSKDALKDLLEIGKNYNDDGTLNDDLGYLLYLKSDINYNLSHVLSITCSCYSDLFQNCVTLNVGKNEGYSHLTNIDVLKSMYLQLVDIWKPETGIIRRNDDIIFTGTHNVSK